MYAKLTNNRNISAEEQGKLDPRAPDYVERRHEGINSGAVGQV